MSSMPWFRFFPSDWLGGTRGLSALEAGVYINLLATMYERGEPLADEPAKLARMCGATVAQFKAAIETLVGDGKIVRLDGTLWNVRVEKELSERAEKSTTAQKSANELWKKKRNKNNDGVDANALPTHSERNASQKPEARSQKEDADASAGGADDRLVASLIDAAGQAIDPTRYGFQDLSRPKAWLAEGCLLETDILPAIRRVAERAAPMSIKNWRYFDGAVADARANRTKPLPIGQPAAQSERKPFVQKIYGITNHGDTGGNREPDHRTDAAVLASASGDGRREPGFSDERVAGLVQGALNRGP